MRPSKGVGNRIRGSSELQTDDPLTPDQGILLDNKSPLAYNHRALAGSADEDRVGPLSDKLAQLRARLRYWEWTMKEETNAFLRLIEILMFCVITVQAGSMEWWNGKGGEKPSYQGGQDKRAMGEMSSPVFQ